YCRGDLYITQLNINVDFEELASAILESNLNTAMKSIAVTVLNAYMEMERDHFVNTDFKQKHNERIAQRNRYYERDLIIPVRTIDLIQKYSERIEQRNGYYERDFMIPVGTLHLKVPRTRDGEFTTEVFDQYSRSDQSLILAIIEAYINGVSTRNITKIVEALAGKSVSKSDRKSVV